MSLGIPPIPEEMKGPVLALVRAAYLFRGLLVESLRDLSDFPQGVKDRQQALELAEKVLDRWVSHMGVEVKELPG